MTLCCLNITQIISDLLTKIQRAVCKHSRYLQSSGSQHSGPLILGHVRRGDSLLVCLLTLSCRKDLHILLIFLLNRKKTHRFGLSLTTNIIISRLDVPYYLSRCFGFFLSVLTSSTFSRSSNPSSSSA